MSEKAVADRPRVSVVIATYNRSRMVREAVLSAWQQALRPAEIVVSDDCSTDDTLRLLRELQKEVPILRMVENSKNSGGVPNWNRVIEASQGDIIAWCSDDDRFTKEHLERAVGYLTEHEDVDLVHAGFEEVFDGGEGGIVNRRISLKAEHPIVVTRHNAVEYSSDNFSWPFHPSTLVFRRALWEEVGPFDARYALADTDWFLRAAVDHRLVYLPYYGTINRRHLGGSGNWSGRVGSIDMQRELYQALHSCVRLIRMSNDVTDLDQQLSRWTSRYRILLVRIFVSRSRAGKLSVAKDCATEITNVTPILSRIPTWLATPTADGLSVLLSWLQLILSGGRKKYRDLGTYMPS